MRQGPYRLCHDLGDLQRALSYSVAARTWPLLFRSFQNDIPRAQCVKIRLESRQPLHVDVISFQQTSWTGASLLASTSGVSAIRAFRECRRSLTMIGQAQELAISSRLAQRLVTTPIRSNFRRRDAAAAHAAAGNGMQVQEGRRGRRAPTSTQNIQIGPKDLSGLTSARLRDSQGP